MKSIIPPVLSRKYPVRSSGNSCVVDHKSRFGARLVSLHVFSGIDIRILGSCPAAGVIGGQPPGFFKGPVGELLIVAFYDHMGSGHFLGVEPPVISCGEFKGQFVRSDNCFFLHRYGSHRWKYSEEAWILPWLFSYFPSSVFLI